MRNEDPRATVSLSNAFVEAGGINCGSRDCPRVSSLSGGHVDFPLVLARARRMK
jgi:hypothetical protein